MEVKGKPLSYLPLSLGGVRGGEEPNMSPLSPLKGTRGEDTIRMDKAPPLGGGGGEVKGKIHTPRQHPSFLLQSEAITSFPFLSIPK